MKDESGSNPNLVEVPPSSSRSQPDDEVVSTQGAGLILLVEDNPADVHLVREALNLHQVTNELTVLQDGAKAVKFIEAIDRDEIAPPRLVILDLNLPKRNGLEVLQSLRMSPRCAEIPVVILSSSGEQKDRQAAQRLGATRYIRKPSELTQFMSIGAELKCLLRGGVLEDHQRQLGVIDCVEPDAGKDGNA